MVRQEKKNLLLVDDEADILELVRHHLNRNGFNVFCATTGEEALKMIQGNIPDLIILDIMLPGIDGLEVAKRLIRDPVTQKIPILMLSAKTEEADIVLGLEIGACDYVTKPFSPRELVARVRAILRNHQGAQSQTPDVIQIHDFTIYPGQRKVFVNDRAIQLTQAEFSILELLAQRPGWVFTRSQIVDAIHDDDCTVTDRSVDVQVYGLRKKLGPARRHIETVWRAGYRFKK